MYVPAVFAEADAVAVGAFVDAHPLATLVRVADGRPHIDHVPFLRSPATPGEALAFVSSTGGRSSADHPLAQGQRGQRLALLGQIRDKRRVVLLHQAVELRRLSRKVRRLSIKSEYRQYERPRDRGQAPHFL
jgi:hypothetical protein